VDCLDKRFAYGPNSYAIGYGLKYCRRFSSLTSKDLTPAGLKWRDATMRCLQNKLAPLLSGNLSSDAITNFAFNSHPGWYLSLTFYFFSSHLCVAFLLGCYTNNGSVTICDEPRNFASVMTIVDPADLFSARSGKQVAQVGLTCGKEYLKHAANWAKNPSLPSAADVARGVSSIGAQIKRDLPSVVGYGKKVLKYLV
jgi:hypothetical protein